VRRGRKAEKLCILKHFISVYSSRIILGSVFGTRNPETGTWKHLYTKAFHYPQHLWDRDRDSDSDSDMGDPIFGGF